MNPTEQALSQLKTAAGEQPQQNLSRQVVAGQFKKTHTNSPVNKAHLLTFSGEVPAQHASPLGGKAFGGQSHPLSDTKLKLAGSFNQEESDSKQPFNPKVSHQTPFFSRLDQKMKTEKSTFSPSTERSGLGDLPSGSKLMHQLMAISEIENIQLKPEKAEQSTSEGQAGSSQKKSLLTKHAALAELTSQSLVQQNPVLSPKVKLMRNRMSGALGDVAVLPKSFTTASLQTGQKKLDEREKKGQQIKFLPSRTNPATRINQTKSAYLTTTKVVKYESRLDSGATPGGSSNKNQLISEGKQPKPGAGSRNYPPQFNPALIYGKQSVTQPKPTPSKPGLSRTAISDNRSKEGGQETKIHQTPSQLQPPKTQTKELQMKSSKKFASYAGTTKNNISKSSVLTRNQLKPGIQRQPPPTTSATTTTFKRNRHLIDKNGQRVQLESSKSQTFSQATQQVHQQHSTVDSNQISQQQQPPARKADRHIDVQVNIQSTPMSAQNQLIPASILNEVSRPIQTQQQQKRQVPQIQAQIKQNSNSSLGFTSQQQQQEEIIQLSQLRATNGDITTQLSFKFNRNPYQEQQTGVQLKLTHGEDPFASGNQPIMHLSMPHQQYQNSGENQNFQAQDYMNQMLLSPQHRHLNPTLYQTYQANFQQVADETFSTVGSPSTIHYQQFPSSKHLQEGRSNRDASSDQYQFGAAPLLFERQQNSGKKTVNTVGRPQRNYNSQPMIRLPQDGALHQEMSLETYFRRQQQQRAVYDMVPTPSTLNHPANGTAGSLQTNPREKENQSIDRQKHKDHFQRILTAKSQQILTRGPKNATNGNPPRRKYRPVLPKNPNNLISLSVKLSKSPTSNTVQRNKQSVVSDNRTLSPKLNTEARGSIENNIDDGGVFSFKKKVECEEVAVFQGKEDWAPITPDEQSSNHSQYNLYQPYSSKQHTGKQQRETHTIFTPTKQEQSDPNVTATFLVSGLPTASRLVTEEKRNSCRREDFGQFSENQLTVGKIRRKSSQAVTPFKSSEQNRRSNTSHSQKHPNNNSSSKGGDFTPKIYEFDHQQHQSLQNSKHRRTMKGQLNDLGGSLQLLQQQIPRKSTQDEFPLSNRHKSSFLDEQIGRERRQMSIENIDRSSGGSHPLSPPVGPLSANQTPRYKQHQTLEQAMMSHLQHRQFQVPARSSITSKSRRALDSKSRKANTGRLLDNEIQSQASVSRSDKEGALSVGHRIQNTSRLFPGQAHQSIKLQQDTGGFTNATTPQEERAQMKRQALMDQKKYPSATLDNTSDQFDPQRELFADNHWHSNPSQCFKNQLLQINSNRAQEAAFAAETAEYAGPGEELPAGTRGANLDSQNRNMLNFQQYGGANPLSIESMSQASSTRRAGKVKVIYNKFFKQKGFFPPLAAQTKDNYTQNHVSRSQSVNSHVSYDSKTNGTIESLRLRTNSPESHAPFIGSSEHSESRIMGHQRPPRGLNQAKTLSTNRDESSQKKSQHGLERLDRLKSTADKADHIIEPDSSLLKNINLVDYSLESKKDNLIDKEEKESCFEQALNNALSHAPIQQRSYPQLAKPFKLEDSVPQWASDEKPPTNILRNQFSLPKHGSSHFSKNYHSQKSFQPQNSLGATKGIKYTGKQKPDEVIKRFSKIYQRKSVTENSERNILLRIMPRKQSDVCEKTANEPIELFNYQEEMPSQMTEPDPALLIQEGDEGYILHDDDQDGYLPKRPPLMGSSEKVTFIQKIKMDKLNSKGFAEIGSEERKAEGQQQEALKKIFKNDKQKQRLKSSKIMSNPKISQGVMSPIKGLRKLKAAKQSLSRQFLPVKTEEFPEVRFETSQPGQEGKQDPATEGQQTRVEASRLSSYLNRIESEQTNLSQPKVNELNNNSTGGLLIQANSNSFNKELARPYASLKQQQSKPTGNNSIQMSSMGDANSVGENLSQHGKPPKHQQLISMSRNHMTEKNRVSTDESPSKTYMIMSKRIQSLSGESRQKISPLLKTKDTSSGKKPLIAPKEITPSAKDTASINGPVDSFNGSAERHLGVDQHQIAPVLIKKQTSSFRNSYISSQRLPVDGETNLTFGLIQQQSHMGSLIEQERQRKSCLLIASQKSASSLVTSSQEGVRLAQGSFTETVPTPFMIPGGQSSRLSLNKQMSAPLREEVNRSIEELKRIKRNNSVSSKPMSIAITDQESHENSGVGLPKLLQSSKSGTAVGYPGREGSFSEYYER